MKQSKKVKKVQEQASNLSGCHFENQGYCQKDGKCKDKMKTSNKGEYSCYRAL